MNAAQYGERAVNLIASAVALVTSSLFAEQRPVFRSEVRQVLLQATVRNARGAIVTGLDRDAFRVSENGKPQPVVLFRRDDVPVSLGIALDNSRSMRGKRASVEAAALALVRASNPDDEVFVLNFGDKPRIDVPLTRDVARLEAGLARVDSIGGTALWDSLETAAAYLDAHAAHDRRLLLVISDGVDNASQASEQAVRERALRTGIVVHAIGLLDVEPSARARRGRHELDELVEQTGGLAYFPSTLERVGGVAVELARQIRSQYTIGYTPTNQALDGSFRKIRVEAKGPERLYVRTRKGYRATAERSGGRINDGEGDDDRPARAGADRGGER